MIAPAAGFPLPPVPVASCSCGVCYDPECHVFAHRAAAEIEEAEIGNWKPHLRLMLNFWADRLGRRVVGWRMVPVSA